MHPMVIKFLLETVGYYKTSHSPVKARPGQVLEIFFYIVFWIHISISIPSCLKTSFYQIQLLGDQAISTVDFKYNIYFMNVISY